MSSSCAKDFLENFKSITLPAAISGRFEIIMRLDNNNDTSSGDTFCETYLLSEKNTTDPVKLYVLKRYLKNGFPFHANESKILSSLLHESIPKYLSDLEIEEDGYLFTIREYAQGTTLDKYLNENHIDEAKAVKIMLQLCDILIFLHDRKEPVIHRDIKPANIVINNDNNSIKLIDFGISRKYNETAETDTVCLGTRNFAPPEQYGFAQTDNRTDIYALGILLRFMLTGSVEKKSVIKNESLEQIASKCSEIDREKRFKTAAALKKALLEYKTQKRRKILKVVFAAFTVCIIAALTFIFNPFWKEKTDVQKFAAFMTQNENNRKIFNELGWDPNNIQEKATVSLCSINRHYAELILCEVRSEIDT